MKELSLILFLIVCLSCNQTADTNNKSEKPNILFAIADDVSYPHMGAYGTAWVKTPAFDRVAREGLLFQNAYTPNAKCSPSRSIILTGRNSWQLEKAANHVPDFPAKFKTIWEALKEHGYATGHTTKGWAPGNPGVVDGVPRELVGKAYNEVKVEPPTQYISRNDYAANFDAFLAQREEGKPFSFWYGSIEPHRAYEYGTGVSLGGKQISDIDKVFDFWPQSDTVINDVLDYAFELEYFDLQLAKMLKKLEDIGELDNTLVIVTADNGMPFPRVKGQAYERSNHLPLAMMWGNEIKKPGSDVEEYISFADFAPTLLDVAGIEGAASGMQAMEGKSMLDLIKGERSKPVRDYIIIGKERHDVGRPQDQGYPIRGIVQGDHLFLLNLKPDRWPAGNPETGYLNCDGSATKSDILNLMRSGQNSEYWQWNFGKRAAEELYNIKADPDCVNNLAGSAGLADTQQLLKTTLLDALKQQGDPRVMGTGDVFDNYVYSGDAHRDFYTRFKNGELDNTSAGWVNPEDFEEKEVE